MKSVGIKGFVLAVTILPVAISQGGTLREAVNTALKTNPEIFIRTSSADAQTDAVRQARAGYLPTVDLSAGVGFENSRNATTVAAYRSGSSRDKDQNRTRRDANITLRQMIFDGFATSSEVNRQLASKEASDYEVCSISEDIALQATRAYTEVMKNEHLLSNAKHNVQEHERIVELIRKRGNTMGTEADVAQAESRLVLAKANQISTEAFLRDSKTAYQRIVGNLPKRFSRPGSPDNLPQTLESAVNRALASHPVVMITDADVNEAEAQYEASKSRFMPRVTAELGADWGADRNGGKGTNYNHTAMLKMSFNLYNGGADSARRSQTSKLINEAIEIRSRAVRQIQEEVRLAWIAVDSGKSRLRQLTAHEKNAKRALDLYNRQFEAGSRTLLDLLDSQNEFYSATNSRTSADYDLIYSKYRLLHSEGSLLGTLQASLPVENRCGLAVNQG